MCCDFIDFDEEDENARTDKQQAWREASPISEASSCTAGRHESLPNLEDVFADDVIDLTPEGDINPRRFGALADVVFEKTIPINRHICINDIVQVAGMVLGTYPVDFVQVKEISGRGRAKHYRGLPLTRTRNMCGKLPKKLNELCMILHIPESSDRHGESHLFVEFGQDLLIKVRKTIFTNSNYPDHSVLQTFRPRRSHNNERTKHKTRRQMEQTGILVCRWRLKIYFPTGALQSRPTEEALERIPASDIEKDEHRVLEKALSVRWRGRCNKGGSWDPHKPSMETDCRNGKPDEQSNGMQFRNKGQKYTLFDAFCGGGGVSRGAQSADFKVSHAVDKAEQV